MQAARTSLLCLSGAIALHTTAAAQNLYQIEFTGTQYDTAVAVYTGGCGAANEIGCAQDGNTTRLTFDAVANETYLIQVGASDSGVGCGLIEITEDPGKGVPVCAGDANSTGAGATLAIHGSDVAADNDVEICVNGLPLHSMGYLVTSMETNEVVHPGGSAGTLCIASFTMGRFAGDVLDSGTLGAVSFSPNLAAFPSPFGDTTVLAGETRYFQHWYRDVDGMGMPTSNFSGAQGVTFR